MSNKILLIDSEPLRTQELARPLAAAGFEIISAGAGAEALACYDASQPGLVLIECEQDVLELCKSLQAKDPGGNTPIAMHGHHPSLGGLPEPLKAAGCRLYIETPVSDEQLVDVCRELLREIAAPIAPEPTQPSAPPVVAVEPPVQPSDTMLGAMDVDEALGNLDDIIDAAVGQPVTHAKEQAGDFTDILGKAGERVEQTPEESIDLSIIDDRITSMEAPPTLEESRAASAARAEAQAAAEAEARAAAEAKARAAAEAEAQASETQAEQDEVFDLEIDVEALSIDDDDEIVVVPVEAIPEPIAPDESNPFADTTESAALAEPASPIAAQSKQPPQDFTFDLDDGTLEASDDEPEPEAEPIAIASETVEVEEQIAGVLGPDSAPTPVEEPSEDGELSREADHPPLIGLEDDELAWSDDGPSMPGDTEMSVPPFLECTAPEPAEPETDMAGAMTNPGIAPMIPMADVGKATPRRRFEEPQERASGRPKRTPSPVPTTSTVKGRGVRLLSLFIALVGSAAWLFVPGSPIHYTLWAGNLNLPFIGRVWTPPEESAEAVNDVPAPTGANAATVTQDPPPTPKPASVPTSEPAVNPTAAPSPAPGTDVPLDEPDTGNAPIEETTADPIPEGDKATAPEPVDATQSPGPGFEPPARRLRVVPDFTEEDRAAHAGDRVVLRVLIGTDGTVDRVLIREGIPGTSLVSKAIDAVMETKYRPAMQDGEPVAAWTIELFDLR